MSRKRQGLSPTLFPFLAVLVCTLGTLILLLALVTRQAEQSARAQAQQQAAAEVASAEDLEDAQWWRTQMLAIRQEQTAALEERRSALAHLEDHARRLRNQLEELGQRATAAREDLATPADDLTRTTIARLEAEIAERQEEIDALSEKATDRPPRVAILPHRGPNGTRRQPVYLECVADAVILQPEGVRIPVDLLRATGGPGNPLDAALRTVRQHHQQSADEPPYPLIVVRPDGVLSYAAARVAMASWDDQFGYELVPGDVELEFPPARKGLRKAVESAIAEAVVRQRRRLAAMPSRYRAGGSTDALDAAFAAARAAAGPATGTAAAGVAYGGGHSDTPGLSEASRSAGGPSAAENDLVQHGSAGLPPGAALGDPLGQWRRDLGTAVAGHGTTAERIGTADGASGGGAPAGTGPQASGTSASFSQNMASSGGSPAASASPPAGTSASPPAGESNGAEATAADLQSTGGTAAGPLNPMATSGSGGASSHAGSAPSAAPSSSAAPAGDRSANGASPSQAAQAAQASQAAQAASMRPLAEERGSGWALSGLRGQNESVVVRYLPLHCEADRLVLPSVSGRSRPRTFYRQDDRPTAAAVALAEELRRRIESWGPALSGGTWQPVLRIEVAPGGETHYQQLERLLDGSGIQLQRSH